MMFEQEDIVHIPLQGRHNFGGPQGENAGPFFKHYCEEFQDGTKQGPF